MTIRTSSTGDEDDARRRLLERLKEIRKRGTGTSPLPLPPADAPAPPPHWSDRDDEPATTDGGRA